MDVQLTVLLSLLLLLLLQCSLDLVGIVEEAIMSNWFSHPLLSPMKPLTQVMLPDNSAYLYTTDNTVHSSCCVQLYMQVSLFSVMHCVVIAKHMLRGICKGTFDMLFTQAVYSKVC